MADGSLATTGVALDSWIVAGLGLLPLGLTIVMLTARRSRS